MFVHARSIIAVTGRVFEALGLVQSADVARLVSDDVQDSVNLGIAFVAFVWIVTLLGVLLEAMRRFQ